MFSIAVPDREDDDSVCGDAGVALAAPVRVDQAGVDEQVHVVAGGEEDEVRLEAVRDGARLVGRGAVRLVEADAAAVRRLLPGLDDLAHHRLRRRVADERKRRVAGGSGRSAGDREGEQDARQKGQFVCVVHRHGRDST